MHTISSDVAKQNNNTNALSDVELLALHEKQRKEAKEAAERKLRDQREAVVKAASDLPEGQAALAARQAAEQAKLDAERAIQAAKDAAQTAMEHHNNDTDSDDDQGINMNISSFEDFQNAANLKREKKRAKAKAKAAKRAREDAEDAAALGEVDDDAAAGYNAKKSKAAADVDTLTEEAYEERVTKQVTKYVFEQLKLKRDRDILTKKQCKKYEQKIVRTVIDHAKESTTTKLDPSVAFMTSQRKEKIKSLVNKYAVVGQKENENKKNKGD